jgi:uncharacterized protein YajQ (UPF0234 family)
MGTRRWMFRNLSFTIVSRPQATVQLSTASQRRLRRLLDVAAKQAKRLDKINHAAHDAELVRRAAGTAGRHC